MIKWFKKLKFWQNKAKSDFEPLVILPPKTFQEMFDECDGSSAYSNDRSRPYNGQAHTHNGLRGKQKVKGITIRDLVDCYVKACLLSSPQDKFYNRVLDGNWLASDLYKMDWDGIDPIAISQNMVVEVEKIMGIYPNVPNLKK